MELKNFFVQDDQGNVMPDATCYLYERGTESLILGLVQPTGAGLMNPFKSGQNGLVQFGAANGLYDLRVISDKRDFRLPIQFNDVSDSLTAAQAAAARAETASDAAQTSAGIYANVAAGLAAGAKYFSVPSAESTEYLVLYENRAGAAVEIKRFPSVQAVTGLAHGVAQLKETAVTKESFDADHFVDAMYDESGAVALGIKKDGDVVAAGVSITDLDLRVAEATLTTTRDSANQGIYAALVDEAGNSPLGFDQEGDTHVGSVEFETRDYTDIVLNGRRVLFPIYDESKNLVFGIDRKTGKLIADLYNPTLPPTGLYVSPALSKVVGMPKLNGLTIDLSAVTLEQFGVAKSLANVTLDAATIDANKVVSGYSLKYVAGVTHPVQNFFSIDVAAWLGYSSVAVESVVRESDSVTLVRGVDYAYSEHGKIAGRANIAAFPVTVKFTGSKERYDAVVYDIATQALAVRKGMERPITAHEDLYRGKPLVGDIHLFNAYVIGGAIRELIPVWNWRGLRNSLQDGPMNAMLDKGRRCLAKFRTKLLRGDGVVISGYGDSNTGLGGAPYSSAADYLPNRVGADGSPFGGPFYSSSAPEADFAAAYMAAVGSYMVNGSSRYKSGPNWSLIESLIKSYGYTFAADKIPAAKEIIYLNHGIGGTTSSSANGQGSNPERLAAMINPDGFRTPDLVVVAFGMNDSAAVPYVQNMSAIISSIRDSGADVIVVGPHLTNSTGVRFTLTEWRLMHQRLSEVAEFYGAAFVPADLYHGGDFAGYAGISSYSLTRSNWYNHPGPYERRKFGEMIAQFIIL